MGPLLNKNIEKNNIEYFEKNDLNYIIKDLNNWIDNIDYIIVLENFSKVNPKKAIEICETVINYYCRCDRSEKIHLPMRINHGQGRKIEQYCKERSPLYHIFNCLKISKSRLKKKKIINIFKKYIKIILLILSIIGIPSTILWYTELLKF
jgi:hypothetical protein